ncbi:MAG: glycosyltransferase family 4 protein [Verrucomicrobiota bacterium]|jgi:glycosyltransferase involved in cell wall biosynthesis
MKLVVFAHTPPPHHGQSYMVQLMLEGFGGDVRRRQPGAASPFGIDCYHVNARFSETLEDVGEFQGGKILLIFWFCLQALWLRFRHGAAHLYYVPAPGKRVALYRDWLVMLFCRPFFTSVILHWHAAGLAKWLETASSSAVRSLTYRLYRPVTLSIVLSQYNAADAEKLLSRNVRVVRNGIMDPCPDFEVAILPRRRARVAARQKLLAGEALSPVDAQAAGGDPHLVKVLFLAHCMRQKGLFDALEGVVEAERQLRGAGSPLGLELTVAGEFPIAAERAEFEQRLADLAHRADSPPVRYVGFVGGDRKRQSFIGADIFCFPTYYFAESFGLVIVEAMAFGLPVVATRWRNIPELFPDNYPGLVPARSPGQIAAALQAGAALDLTESMRRLFLDRYTFAAHLSRLAEAIRSVETAG